MSNSQIQKLCGLCNKNPSKYCCPKCEELYCSLECYKSEKHIECSENFYKDCVNLELSSLSADDDSKKKMLDILKRMQEQNSNSQEETDESEGIDSDDEEHINLEKRIQDLNLDNPDCLWDALTEDERNEFEALVSDGNVGSIVPYWEPWWTYRRDKKLVQEINTECREQGILKSCPKIKSVKKLSELTSVKPSPSITFNVANVLASYAFIMRYFNGDVEPVEGVSCILSICDNLDKNINFNDPESAVEAVAQKCLQSTFIVTDKDSLEIMRHDTILLFEGPSEDNKFLYTKAALSDIIQVMSDAKSQLNCNKVSNCHVTKGAFSKKFPEHSNDHLPPLDISKLKKCMKKLEFYLSYLNTCN
ncbi:zinc finger HIT domain-containing protein 2 isoform X1 [Leptidea sinapis]|uniref:zinc finger HIT domain-containing protein 2 isoform X1 n=1 Tax=Leptidea sinapis TaxID=189913 RepID=UPI0021C457E2|nr:zinc finger HIT domain-containing protein 2 isoform X1 [Leptidea sinapis]